MHIKTNLDNLLVLHRVKRAVDVKLAHVSLDIEIRQTALKLCFRYLRYDRRYTFIVKVLYNISFKKQETKSKTMAFLKSLSVQYTCNSSLNSDHVGY